VARIASLLVLDYAAIFAAILTALCLKAALLDAWDFRASLDEAEDTVSFAYLVAALLFARSGLYAERAARPGLTKIVASLFQTTLVTLLFALVNGEQFSSYYIFYGSLFFCVIYVSGLRHAYEWVTGLLLRMAGYRRRAVLVGTGHHIEAVAHALRDGSDVELMGFVSLTPRPDNGLRSLGRLDDIEAIASEHRLDEVIIADPDFPEEAAVELVDRCHRRGVRVRVAPSTMSILVHRAEFVPGQTVPLFELKPPVFDGVDFAIKRAFDVVVSILLLLVALPALIAMAAAVRLTSRGPVIYRSWRPGIGGAPFACLKFRTMYRDADQRQADLESLNEASARCSRSATTRG
jgi:FlaA1/EpsC-like NDP-sugar epimerase